MADIGAMCRERKVFLHTDAAQVRYQHDVDVFHYVSWRHGRELQVPLVVIGSTPINNSLAYCCVFTEGTMKYFLLDNFTVVLVTQN